MTRQKTPPPDRRHEATIRLERVPSEVRAHRHGVREWCRPVPRLEVGRRIRARGLADVAPLRVDDHEEPGSRRVLAHLLERPHAIGPEHLEACGLRLDRHDVRADGVDQAAAEARERIGCLGAAQDGLTGELERQELEPRVEAHDELAALAP